MEFKGLDTKMAPAEVMEASCDVATLSAASTLEGINLLLIDQPHFAGLFDAASLNGLHEIVAAKRAADDDDDELEDEDFDNDFDDDFEDDYDDEDFEEDDLEDDFYDEDFDLEEDFDDEEFDDDFGSAVWDDKF
ncbi:hypothetical protein [Rhodoflexus sp.]